MIARLHVVTDDVVLQQSNFISVATELLLVLQRRLALHIRGHSLSAQTLFKIANELKPRADIVGSALIINDRVDIALATVAHGVQVGARSLPVATVRELGENLLIGYSAHDAAESGQAERDGANFVFAGSIYLTASHPEIEAGGLPLLESCVSACSIPVLAIGGVTAEHIPDILRTGAHGVAVIRTVWHAADPVHAADEIAKLLEA